MEKSSPDDEIHDIAVQDGLHDLRKSNRHHTHEGKQKMKQEGMLGDQLNQHTKGALAERLTAEGSNPDLRLAVDFVTKPS